LKERLAKKKNAAKTAGSRAKQAARTMTWSLCMVSSRGVLTGPGEVGIIPIIDMLENDTGFFWRELGRKVFAGFANDRNEPEWSPTIPEIFSKETKNMSYYDTDTLPAHLQSEDMRRTIQRDDARLIPAALLTNEDPYLNIDLKHIILDIGFGLFPLNRPPWHPNWFFIPFKIKESLITVSSDVLSSHAIAQATLMAKIQNIVNREVKESLDALGVIKIPRATPDEMLTASAFDRYSVNVFVKDIWKRNPSNDPPDVQNAGLGNRGDINVQAMKVAGRRGDEERSTSVQVSSAGRFKVGSEIFFDHNFEGLSPLDLFLMRGKLPNLSGQPWHYLNRNVKFSPKEGLIEDSAKIATHTSNSEKYQNILDQCKGDYGCADLRNQEEINNRMAKRLKNV